MKKGYFRYGLASVFVVCLFALFVSCGSGGGSGNIDEPDGSEVDEPDVPEVDGEPGAVEPDKISLGTSQVSVLTNDGDNAILTATVLDVNNAVVEGVWAEFSASGGKISASSVQTDANGEAQIIFTSGTMDKSNRVVTISAKVEGLNPAQIPIQVTGTTISFPSYGKTNLTVGELEPSELTVLVQDAASIAVYNALVTLSAAPAGVVTLSQQTGYTDVMGNLEVDIRGTGAGDVTVTVQALGTTATKDYTVGGTSDEVFGITSPPDDPYSLFTGGSLQIIVNAPDQQEVEFATTLGTLEGTNPRKTGQVIKQDVSGGSASALLSLSSEDAGTATVQVSDAADSLITDSLTVAVSAPSSEAAQITLQANATVVAPSTGDTSNSVTLTVTVRNATDQVVSGVPVAFSIEDPTGGGEFIFPVVAYTDGYGDATSTFTSGALSTHAAGVTVWATMLVGTGFADSIEIVIGGTAGSVTIGRGTEIESINDDTAYRLPMSVLVADSNGNPVSGTTVSLSAWPVKYSTGFWCQIPCDPIVTGTYVNEDSNRNLILDPGEDTGPDPGHGDEELTPPSSTAGTLPGTGTIVTDENGVGRFDLVYLKQHAVWIVDEITASTLVWGTETTSTLEFRLPYLKFDKCYLPDSPFGLGQMTFTITATVGSHGSMSPRAGTTFVDYGDSKTFLIWPDGGYVVDEVLVDGERVGLSGQEDVSYTFFEVTEDHTIKVTFK